MVVADGIDNDADAVDGSAVVGTVVDVVSGAAAVLFLGSVKSYVPRLFTKKLNEPTVRSKSDSSQRKFPGMLADAA